MFIAFCIFFYSELAFPSATEIKSWPLVRIKTDVSPVVSGRSTGVPQTTGMECNQLKSPLIRFNSFYSFSRLFIFVFLLFMVVVYRVVRESLTGSLQNAHNHAAHRVSKIPSRASKMHPRTDDEPHSQ